MTARIVIAFSICFGFFTSWVLAKDEPESKSPKKVVGEEVGLTIMGSIIQDNPESNVALIKEKSGRVRAVRKGHVVRGEYKVLGIHEKYIELLAKDKSRYMVFQDKFAGTFRADREDGQKADIAAPNDDYYKEEGFERRNGEITMTAMYRDKLVQQDLAKVLMQATAEPTTRNGKIVGFRLSQIDKGSIYDKSGLENGDIVTQINGRSLNSVGKSISLLKSLKDADHMEVTLERNGKTMTYTVDVQ